MPKLPTEPYPGLRPFHDYEAPLLMGRAQQVREIIKSLETTRFVAVVGGSGCGKSSLIRAGVVPKLRGLGMPDQGDYWIPVVYTPGTTRADARTAAGVAAGDEGPDSPIVRLVRRFSKVLEPTTEELDKVRREEIAKAFRESGFSALVHRYSDELQAAGPKGTQARFVFVIDQFEELFHPNNHGSVDAIKTIEAVINHFYNPHERCFVVLTMRSEHLADCAAYLELPDAINKSIYLVRRLSELEIREAVVAPAKYYLRLKRRAYDAAITLPEDVIFDEHVIERLLKDAFHIANDADHLPLLQHVLARTWYAACQREQVPVGGVPSAVRWEDLEHAVAPQSSQSPGWLLADERVNALRFSLDNWAEHTYAQRSSEERTQIDAVLRRLAFRDPNSGLYFQQRLEVKDRGVQAVAARPEQLWTLLQRGFLDTVNYLFWDDENPDRVTLKVSHEAFIRGWERFRKLIDREAERFDEFVSLLRKCQAWKAKGSPSTSLLADSELASIEEKKLEDVFGVQDERRSWFRHLLEYRDGSSLAELDPHVDEFLSRSRQQVETNVRERRDAALREEQARADALKATAESRLNRSWFRWTAAAALLALVAALFLGFVDRPVRNSVMEFNDARKVATPRDLKPGDSQGQLEAQIKAARLIARTKAQGLFSLVDTLQSMPAFVTYKNLLENSSSEPDVNGSLRQLLTTTVWPDTPDKSQSGPSLVATMIQSNCQASAVNSSGSMTRTGMLVRAAHGSHAMFVSDELTPRGPGRIFYSAAVSADECTLGPSFYYVVNLADPGVVVDANLAYLAVVQRADMGRADGGRAGEDSTGGKGSASLYGLQWGLDPQSPHATLRPLPPVIDTPGDPKTAADYIRSEVADDGIRGLKPVATWLVPGGSVVAVGMRHWRLFPNTFVPEPTDDAQRTTSESWTELRAPASDSGCLTRQNGFKGSHDAPMMFEFDSICFEVGPKTVVGQPDAMGEIQRDYLVWVLDAYTSFQAAQAAKQGSGGPVPLTSIPLESPRGNYKMWIGKPGSKWKGWVGLEETGKPLQVAPWATSALATIGCDVLESNHRSSDCAGSNDQPMTDSR